MNKTALIALATGVILIDSAAANAQTAEPGRIFVNVNVGAQMQTHTLTSSLSFPLYGQTASVNTAQNIEAGPFFDVSVGGRLRNNLGAAFGFGTFKKGGELVGSASIPHPLFFNAAKQVDFTTGADHHARNIYFVAVWFVPINERFSAMLSGGPTFIRVRQATLANIVVPSGTQDMTPTIEEQAAWGTGINVGADVTYHLHTAGQVGIGVGGFLRYNGASIELPSGADVDAGGFQGGGGLRLRF